MKLILAPLQGLTDKAFRNAWAMHFKGIDQTISPFISFSTGARYNAKDLHEIEPKNQQLPLVPQLLGKDPGQFIQLAREISNMGYREVNGTWAVPCHKSRKRSVAPDYCLIPQ